MDESTSARFHNELAVEGVGPGCEGEERPQVRSNVRSYYNALLAAGRVHELTLNEAQRDLDSINRVINIPPLFNF